MLMTFVYVVDFFNLEITCLFEQKTIHSIFFKISLHFDLVYPMFYDSYMKLTFESI